MTHVVTRQSQETRMAVLSWVAPLYVKLMSRLVRVEYEETEGTRPLEKLRQSGVPLVLAFHHGQLIPLVLYAIHTVQHGNSDRLGPLSILTSWAEGSIVGRILQEHGIEYITRDYNDRDALAEMNARCLRALRAKRNLALAAEDRPQNSWRLAKVKTGAARFAQATSAALVPVAATVASSAHIRLWRHWDKMIIPLPLGPCRIVVRFGSPLQGDQHERHDKWAMARSLQRKLDEVTEEVEVLASDRHMTRRVNAIKAISTIAFFFLVFASASDANPFASILCAALALLAATCLVVVTRGYYSRIGTPARTTILEISGRQRVLEKYGEMLSMAQDHIAIAHRYFNPHFFLSTSVFTALEKAIAASRIRVEILLAGGGDVADTLASINHYDRNALLDICFDEGTARLERLQAWLTAGDLTIRWARRLTPPGYVIVDGRHIALDVPQKAGTSACPLKADFLLDSVVIAQSQLRVFRRTCERALGVVYLRSQ